MEKKSSGFSFFCISSSIQIKHQVLLTHIPKYSSSLLTISTATIYYYYLPKSHLQFPDWTPSCSLFRESSGKNPHQLISSPANT